MSGKRLYVLGNRVHHGLQGLVMSVVGVVLMWHDRKDAREWFRFHDR